MPELDPRNSFLRARMALGAMIRDLRDADKRLGDDEISRQQHARNLADLADLIDWAGNAADLADANSTRADDNDEDATG